MSPPSYTVECWDLYVWRGHWVLRSRHGSQAELLKALAGVGLRTQVRKSTRRVIGFKQPDRPTEVRKHREAAAAAMMVRQQHMKMYKSGTDGLVSLPPEDKEF